MVIDDLIFCCGCDDIGMISMPDRRSRHVSTELRLDVDATAADADDDDNDDDDDDDAAAADEDDDDEDDDGIGVILTDDEILLRPSMVSDVLSSFRLMRFFTASPASPVSLLLALLSQFCAYDDDLMDAISNLVTFTDTTAVSLRFCCSAEVIVADAVLLLLPTLALPLTPLEPLLVAMAVAVGMVDRATPSSDISINDDVLGAPKELESLLI